MDYIRYTSDLHDDDKFTGQVTSIERLDAIATELAEKLRVTGSREGKDLLAEIKHASSELTNSYLHLTKTTTPENITPPTEWFLDNFHIIEKQLLSIKRDLPRGFYQELPKVKGGEFDGYPRVYAIAYTFVVNTDCGLDLSSVIRFVDAYQKITPLTIGELWAIAITFRISLIKRLQPLVDRIIHSNKMRASADALADKLLEKAALTQTTPDELVHFLSSHVEAQEKLSRPFIVQLIQRLRDQDPSISKAFDWLEEVLCNCKSNTEEIVKLEHYRQAAEQVTIGNIISSMRLISNIDWHDFFEVVSLVDPILRRDPTGTYESMDRATRDKYRKGIERIARRSDKTEIDIAEQAMKLALGATERNITGDRKNHVGYYLIDEGTLTLEQSVNYRSPWRERVVRFSEEDPGFMYFGLLFLLIIFTISVFLSVFPAPGNSPLLVLALILLTLIPASEFSLNVLNYAITLIKRPVKLPRMNTEKGIDEADTTMVVVPCLLSNTETIQELVSNLEVQYLANQDENIYFALLGDLKDASTETTELDQNYLAQAQEGIDRLNERYRKSEFPRFSLFTRVRLYNSGEEKWICWERKRGKLMEFNRLLRGATDTTFLTENVDYNFLKKIQYIITLDADTQLPLQNARRLVGTITHPLNRPVYCPKRKRIVAGYGILQPRISVSVVSASRTRFSKIFSGNTGIDPYTTAVSDVYQDVFREGSFTGKGLYHVDAFEKVIGDRVPENSVISHDLLEGCYARVGLTTDMELIDDFPSTFEVYAKRLHRWTRGDWQIALWLLPFVPTSGGKWERNNLPILARWKILDNLRRSLLAPSILLLLLLSWTVLWGDPLTWTAMVVGILGFSVYAPTINDLARRNDNLWSEHLKSCYRESKTRINQILFMLVLMPTIAYTQLDAILRSIYRMAISRKKLLEWVPFSEEQTRWNAKLGGAKFFVPSLIITLLSLGLIALAESEALPVAIPFLAAWMLAPLANRWLKSRTKPKVSPLNEGETQKYRRYARLTWHFFETFAGEKNNWLAPDNFQEDPHPVVAHRTSPTNIGLQFLANLSAYDLGYIGIHELVERNENTLRTMERLERIHGHFYNWYDTQNLAPLHPRYVSTVDSGNLAGHLVVLKEASLKLSEEEPELDRFTQGALDGLSILSENLSKIQGTIGLPQKGSVRQVNLLIDECQKSALGRDWARAFALMKEIETQIHDLVEEKKERIFPWVEALLAQFESYKRDQESDPKLLVSRLRDIAGKAESFAMAMDFKFLYDEELKIFSIGFNVTDGIRDNSYYDLLASEARLASLMAIAKGDVSEEHWFRLGRQLTAVVGSRALVSWSATMFEYLMPLLVMKRYEGTLLDQTYDSVVERQIEYGAQKGSPWGVSEAGYHARDLNFNYQYGPFGVPGLGLKRGLKDELVISPYSTMLASMVFPKEALENLQHMEKMKVLGQFGFHESIDYTGERIHKEHKYVILKSYMAHHQGMSLVAINNILNGFPMHDHFHSDPRIKAVQLLLQERIPAVTQIVKPREEETHAEHHSRFSESQQTRIYVDPNLSTPRTQILSNGNYSVMMSTAGSGFSKCEERMVTRWREDSTKDDWGQFLYIQDHTHNRIWSAGLQPTLTKPRKYEAHFSEDKIEILREDSKISTNTEVIISSEDNVEMRRVSLTNHSDLPVEVEVTSYTEVVLAQGKDDAAHPSFSNLFVQTEFRKETNAILANRRLRSRDEREVWGLHLLTIETGEALGEVQYETDRSRFLGRGRTVHNPIVMSNEIELSGTTGAVLDPIFSLRQKIRIKPHQTARLIFCTGLVYAKDEALRVVEKYHDPHTFLRQVNLGWIKAQISLRHLRITAEQAHNYQRLAGRILYLAPYLRTQSQVIMANQKNQSALWAYGISGDVPILLTRIKDEKDMDMIRDLLRAHEYLRLKGLKIDLLILNEHSTSYLQNLQDELMRQILISGNHQNLDKPGGIFIRRSDLIPEEDLVLIKTVARLQLFANKGSLSDQLRRRPYEPELPSRFMPVSQKKDYQRQDLPLPELRFFNGLGGFTPDGREYVIKIKEDQWTPAPWINVVANKNDFGFLISESGQGYTWSVNSRENRLTPWSNDAVSDPVSEAIYIRDEETGILWSPTPLPIRSPDPYVIRHGQGYTEFEHRSHGLSHRLSVFVPVEDTVKIFRLKLKNLSDTSTRKLSVTSYVDWVLGFSRSQTSQTLSTIWDEKVETILARNSYNNEFAHRIAFLSQTGSVRSFTSDRKEFIGRNGNMKSPAGLSRRHLSGKVRGGIDPCGAIQSAVELNPGEEREIIILLGQAETDKDATELVSKYKDSIRVETAFREVREDWEEKLSTITIKTPDESMDLLVNRWLFYQTLSCRIWARSALYQSGGAFGFRDQLQDVMAMVFADPSISRDQIIRAASRQFPEGDVQHWWHPPTGRGVRTRFSDDLLWLPLVTSYYTKATGDFSVLEEEVPFIETPVLSEGHDETYTQPSISPEKANVFEHCLRAIDRSLRVGDHGLPLMGSGDWNDGMSRVGNHGKGESVWMAWFLIKVLKDFIPLCERKKDHSRVQTYENHIERLKKAIEKNAWDGDWYLRAYFDNGDKLGSSENEECKIDAIAQSWSLISGAGDQERSTRALKAVDKYLVDREEKIIKLFTPPFDKSDADPGYIKGYVPGVRENGGQYTHAAIWTMMGYAALGDGKTAVELFRMINPINRTSTLTGAQKYKVEPYVIAADIYSVSPHVGRGGWTWYTGSSSWMYRSALESILGLRVHGDSFEIHPCIPPEWEEFEIKYRRGKTNYHIKVLNHQTATGVELNNKTLENSSIPFNDNGQDHLVVVKLKNNIGFTALPKKENYEKDHSRHRW